MRLPNFEESRAVLIGTATYDSGRLPDLPAVANNVTALWARLTDSELSGFRQRDCAVIVDPENPDDVLKPLKRAAREARDVLFVYFAGHGLLDEDSDLHLGVRFAHEEDPWTSVRFAEFARLVLGSGARSKIVVLDCCYSGRAIRDLHMSEDGMVARATAQLDIDGLYVLTSSAGNKPSLAPEGETFTAFTGRLLEFIDAGVPGTPELLTMRALYTAVNDEMRHRRLPWPQQHTGNLAGEAALFRNRALLPPPADVPEVAGDVRRTRWTDTYPALRSWRRAVGGGLGLALVTGAVSASAAGSPVPVPCAAPTAIRMLVPLDTVEMFTGITDAYEYATRGGGDCQRVRVTVAGASRDDAARAFVLSWRTPPDASDEDRLLLRRVGLPPDVWVADLGVDMAAVQAAVAETDGAEVRIPGDPERWALAESPIVLAEPGVAGGSPLTRISLAWGKVVADQDRGPVITGVVRPDPDTTAVGRLVNVSLYPDDAKSASEHSRVQRLLDTAAVDAGQGIGTPDIAGLLCRPGRTGLIVAEWQLVRHNSSRCGDAGLAPWNFLYPPDTRWLDYPMVQPVWAREQSDRIRRTADTFTAWLRSSAGDRALADQGLRPRTVGPDAGLIKKSGARTDWFIDLEHRTGTADLERAATAYKEAKQPATVLVAVDGSGSMTARSGGRSRFDAALDGIAASVATMGPRDDFGLFVFSTAIKGGITEIAGQASEATGRARGYPPAGGTPLYQAVDHGVRRLRAQRGGTPSGDRHRILVVLTDGENTVKHPLPQLEDDSVRVVIVNVGMSGCPDARLAALTKRHGDCVGVPSAQVDVKVTEQIERLWQKEAT
ncbi:VWA domain-containing protein [Actinoplanes sp. NPDC023801]|uniref:caspase, EACC1-associated type n=1 Tax=Actinoplanes sp. NPDC023801 TaxID=3154595 RepID=UPI0033CAC5E3